MKKFVVGFFIVVIVYIVSIQFISKKGLQTEVASIISRDLPSVVSTETSDYYETTKKKKPAPQKTDIKERKKPELFPGKKKDQTELNIEIDPFTSEQIEACFGDQNSTESWLNDKFDSLLEAIQDSFGEATEENIDWQNIIVKLPNGKERRIRIEYYKKNAMETYSILKVFGVDSEGDPDIMTIPEKDKTNPDEEIIQSYIQGGDIISNQVSKRYSFSDGRYINTTIIDGKVADIEAFQGEKYLRCETFFPRRHANCECL